LDAPSPALLGADKAPQLDFWEKGRNGKGAGRRMEPKEERRESRKRGEKGEGRSSPYFTY